MIVLPHTFHTPLWTPQRELVRRPRLIRLEPIQFITNNNAATTALVCTLGANPSIGNTLIAGVVSNNSGVTSITGGGAGTGADAWANVNGTGSFLSVEFWKCVVTGTPGTAVTINTPSARIDGLVAEFEGRYTFDQGGGATGTSTAPLSPSITPLFPTELLLGMGGWFGSTSAGPSGGFAAIGGSTSGTMQQVVAMLRAGAIAAQQIGWTLSASVGWDILIASFKTAPYVPSAQAYEWHDQVAS